MSNVIINKDRWQPKPKYQKVKANSSKIFHSEKQNLIEKGYTEEEISKILHKKSFENEKKERLKKEIDVINYLKIKLDMLSIEQHNELLKTLMREYKSSKITKIKKHIDKLVIIFNKDKENFKLKTLNEKSKKDYKKRDFNSVKELRTGSLKIVKS